MAVTLLIDLPSTEHKSFSERVRWLNERVPTKEFHILRNRSSDGDDYWEPDYNYLRAEVSVWSDDADRVATEFWFKFQ